MNRNFHDAEVRYYTYTDQFHGTVFHAVLKSLQHDFRKRQKMPFSRTGVSNFLPVSHSLSPRSVLAMPLAQSAQEQWLSSCSLKMARRLSCMTHALAATRTNGGQSFLLGQASKRAFLKGFHNTRMDHTLEREFYLDTVSLPSLFKLASKPAYPQSSAVSVDPPQSLPLNKVLAL